MKKLHRKCKKLQFHHHTISPPYSLNTMQFHHHAVSTSCCFNSFTTMQFHHHQVSPPCSFTTMQVHALCNFMIGPFTPHNACFASSTSASIPSPNSIKIFFKKFTMHTGTSSRPIIIIIIIYWLLTNTF